MRRRTPIIVLALSLVLGLAPATALPSVPVVGSDNMDLQLVLPNVTAISTTFDPQEPIAYVSTLNGLVTYDISDPTAPVPLGTLPMQQFQNEAVSFGIQPDGTKIALVGFDLYGVTPTDTDRPTALDYEFVVVDVTDPADPHLRGRVETSSSTHTVDCLPPTCEFAYTSGAYDDHFNVIDLRDPDNPEEVAQITAVAGSGHDWDFDDAGLAWHVGTAGVGVYDVTDPVNPVLLNSSSSTGLANRTEYNNFILHNSIRPDAEAFTSRTDEEVIPVSETGPRARRGFHEREVTADDIRPGEVLLVTEEDYIDATCEAEGTFSTWHVQQLDPAINAEQEKGAGTIAPLDNWNTELLDSGTPTPAGAFCSAHYFDYHQDGFVAQGWYQQGLRILDVRDATDIKQVGYWFTGATETWGAYWIPEYDEDGQTGAKTNIVWTNDPVKGLEIFSVALPETDPDDTEDLRAPILPQWLAPDPELEARATSEFGYLCRLAPGL